MSAPRLGSMTSIVTSPLPSSKMATGAGGGGIESARSGGGGGGVDDPSVLIVTVSGVASVSMPIPVWIVCV